jgi:adenosylhomocysteinase
MELGATQPEQRVENTMAQRSDIANIELKGEGKLLSDWAERHMQVLARIAKRFAAEKPLDGIRVAACMHVTAETANLMHALQAGGADLYLCASNPLSTKDPITALLVSEGMNVFAIHGEDRDTYFRHCRQVLEAEPHIVIDDGGDLTRLLHAEDRDKGKNVLGGLEETTTGVIRIRALEKEGGLSYPIVAINDAKTKHMFDNRYGTGQSSIDAIMRSTNLLIAGQKFVVAGFGMCGRGVAMRAKGLGADVIVTEVDPVRALEAVMEGYRVMPMAEAAPIGDVFVTVTGNKHVIRGEHMKVMKDGAIVCNSGHFDIEVDLAALAQMSGSKTRLRSNIEEYTLRDSGRRIVVLGEGRLVNLVAAEGHPASVMDMSFANQALACEYLVKNRDLPKQVIDMPVELDNEVAALKLAAMGMSFDQLTPAQLKYLNSWEEGT